MMALEYWAIASGKFNLLASETPLLNASTAALLTPGGCAKADKVITKLNAKLKPNTFFILHLD
jgi:hypothetical protein